MQFDLHEYSESENIPYVVIVQSSIIEIPGRQMVIPLAKNEDFSASFTKDLFPVLSFGGETYRLLTPEVSSISERSLGAKVGTLAAYENKIKDALNFLFWGY